MHFEEHCAKCVQPPHLIAARLSDFIGYICRCVSVISSLLQEMSRRVSLCILIKAVKAAEVRLVHSRLPPDAQPVL